MIQEYDKLIIPEDIQKMSLEELKARKELLYKIQKAKVDGSTKIDMEIMTENPNMYVNLKELVERFIEIDKYYNHTPWNLEQIITNIRMCGTVEFEQVK